ncbi:hypothetical protein NA57DRAFT_78151 [Rhizodiscina lignyota]|uniref:C2H2-type domain-containing protein n=1 Tax=Rhizodiscina lignyota TaxID=1504668 RepID=A0A9P4IBA3_9PEZI|nr:hypothetical protein NA57DRAFT_78151 [Rhizodiscina lignyota]
MAGYLSNWDDFSFNPLENDLDLSLNTSHIPHTTVPGTLPLATLPQPYIYDQSGVSPGYLPQYHHPPYYPTVSGEQFIQQDFWTAPVSESIPTQHGLFGLPTPSILNDYESNQYLGVTEIPDSVATSQTSRSLSFTSTDTYYAQSSPGASPEASGTSSSSSPAPLDLRAYGSPRPDGSWTCAFPGCTSRAVFTRGCDLRKHHKRHLKSFFCHHEGCPQAQGGGFSSKKDLLRHEAKHNPGVPCDWQSCGRVFSRVDNMRDHVKRIHLKRGKA